MNKIFNPFKGLSREDLNKIDEMLANSSLSEDNQEFYKNWDKENNTKC